MEDSLLSKDVYNLILPHLDWFTLQNCNKTNLFFNFICEKEIQKRLKSNFPFGNPNSKIVIMTSDVYIDFICCILDGKRIYIEKNFYFLPWVKNTLDRWFIYSLESYKFTINSKLFKSIIRIINRRIMNDGNTCIDENKMNLTFEFTSEFETTLIDIK